MIERRAPGQRRRRSRRAEELAAVEALDPQRAEALRDLRRHNPQAYRKELRRLIRAGTIPRGRGFEVPEDLLSLLDGDPAHTVTAALQAAVDAGSLGFRELGGLLQAERIGRAREGVIAWLTERYQARLDDDNRLG